MARSLTLSNGRLLVAINNKGQVCDLYFPHISQENHIPKQAQHNIGIFVNGQLSWLNDSSWEVKVTNPATSLIGITKAHNKTLGISITITDTVYNENNIFLRQLAFTNHTASSRKIILYTYQNFEISGSHNADTAFYDPKTKSIIHYKNRRALLIGLYYKKQTASQYATGLFGSNSNHGTHQDANDGNLSQNPIEHGPTDSCLGITIDLKPGKIETCDYFICLGKSIQEVTELHKLVLLKSPVHFHASTNNYWQAWSQKEKFHLEILPQKLSELFYRSILIVKAHTNHNGAIIASTDTDMLNYGKDTYGYMWPRDGANSALALDLVGDSNSAQSFYKFCNSVISPEGYLMHKYGADTSLGSSWHPWVNNGKNIIPIQPDETANTLFTLNLHYQLAHDLEFIEQIYNSLIKKSANFLASHIDKETNLPLPGYDIWEESYGIHTYTVASTIGGLNAASDFAKLLGKKDDTKKFYTAANNIKKSLFKYLYDQQNKNFIRSFHDKSITDFSAVYGIFKFKILNPNDPILIKAFNNTRSLLLSDPKHHGYARYQNDSYYRTDYSIPGNPWIITSLWSIQFDISRATNEKTLRDCINKLLDLSNVASPTGCLSEQYHHQTLEPISASPLTWSHSEYIHTIIALLNKSEELGLCTDCNPVNI